MSRLIHDLCDWMRIPHPTHSSAVLSTLNRATARRPRVVLAGGSGFLGGLLRRYFAERDWDVVVLTRNAAMESGAVVRWDGRSPGTWACVLDGADVLINLSGRSVNCRYHRANRRLILESRVDSTRVLGETVARCSDPPRVWINLSTATLYRHTFGPAWDEGGEIGSTREAKDAFSIDVANAWERALFEASAPYTRRVALRTAMVLGWGPDANNVYRVLRRLVRWGLGGAMGGGRQFVSWVHEVDFCRAVEFIIHNDTLIGPVNVAAPHPLPNAVLMRTLRQQLRRPLGLPAKKWMLELGALFLRTETELILKSRKVIPGKLVAAGFQFNHPTIGAAVDELEARHRAAPLPVVGSQKQLGRLRPHHAAPGWPG